LNVKDTPLVPRLPDGCRVSLIVPALNEAENLPHVLPFVPAWIAEVILVDGGSTDGTREVARSLRPDLIVLEQDCPGKGAGLLAGFAAAAGDIVVTLDGDGSMDLGEIGHFVESLLAGADFAKGSRFLPGSGSDDFSLLRAAGNFVLMWLARRLFHGKLSDPNYGYNALWKRVLPELALDGQGFEIEMLMNIRAVRAGLNVVEIPCYERKRIYGRSKLHAGRDGWRVLRTILRERFASSVSYDSGTRTKASPVVVGTGRESGKT
jgi:glycosyltransferase involved in cell wall biosynthesis